MPRGLLFLLLLPFGMLCGRPPICPITGAYVKEVQGVITYDNVVPLFYRFPIRRMPPLTTLKTMQGDCSATNKDACAARSAMLSHFKQTETTLHELISSFISTFPDDQSTSSSSEEPQTPVRGRRSIFGFVGNALGYCCDVTTKQDIADLEDNNEAVEDFMKTMKTSIVKEHQYLLQVYNASKADDKGVQTEMEKLHKWAANLTQALKDQGNDLAHREESNEETELQNLISSVISAQIHFWTTETMRISTILHACHSQQLTPIAVPPGQLQDDLLIMQETLSHHKRSLSIAPGFVRKYYRLQITSCVVTDSTITMRVQVPITQDTTRKLFELKRVPFLWQNATCHLRMESTLVTVGKTTSIITGNDLHHCALLTGLCRVPAYHTDLLHGTSCPYKLLSKATTQELSKNCLLQCAPFQSTVVSHVGLHKYVISGLPQGTMINCRNESFPIISPATGSLEVELPCHCDLTINGQGELTAPFPCPGSLVKSTNIIHVIPVAWTLPTSQAISIHTQHLGNTFGNLSDILNTNWTMELPTINLTIPEQILAAHKRIPKLIHHSALILPSFSFVWNAVLSLAVIWLLYQHINFLPYILTMSSLFKPANAEVDFHVALEQLGTVLMLAVAINGVVIFIVICAGLYLLCRTFTTKQETLQLLTESFDVESQQPKDDHTSNSRTKAIDATPEPPNPIKSKRQKRRPRGQEPINE